MKHIKRDFSLNAWVRPPGWKFGGGAEAKIQLFQKKVMLHIKLKVVENTATPKHIFSLYTHSRPLGLGQRSKHFFF